MRLPISAKVRPVARSDLTRSFQDTIPPRLRDAVGECQRHPATDFRSNLEVQPESFGERLKRLRLEQGMDRTELAERAGMPYSTLAEIENTGKESTRGDYLFGLADALGIPARELATGQKDRHDATGVHLTLAENALVRAYRAASAAERRQIQGYLEGIAARPGKPKRRAPGPLGQTGSKNNPLTR